MRVKGNLPMEVSVCCNYEETKTFIRLRYLTNDIFRTTRCGDKSSTTYINFHIRDSFKRFYVSPSEMAIGVQLSVVLMDTGPYRM